MTYNLDERLADLLTALENCELPLLAWGVTDNALTEDEVHAVLSDAVTEDMLAGMADGPSDADYLSELTRRALLHRVPGSSPPRFRTRLAEGMRLLARLSQLFPPTRNAPQDWWQAAPPLVADYRLHVEPRRYPRRDITPTDAIARLAQRRDWTTLHTQITDAVLAGRKMASFQLHAAEAILTAVDDQRGRGLIIGAGTGSGKTLSFYLPAALTVASGVHPGRDQVDVLALYPRKELLRDQAREGAALSLSTAAVLEAERRRPVRIGLLYGDSPYNPTDSRIDDPDSPWFPLGDGARCPYFPCPRDGCGGDLVWPTVDRQAGIERLRCERCGLTLDERHVALTRQSLTARPPDILFSTTEMLSRNASDRAMGGLLGWTGPTAPRLVLLDEVHSYSGVHGAQVALLLRRWRHSVRQRRLRSPVFVGLSATLRDAVPYFSVLTGLSDSTIEYISPSADDLLATGRQYSVILRGDPVSGTSLLSTTLQTAMLMGRLLDPHGAAGMFGSSGFVFTDDLDVTNRLYDDMRDAEGGQSRRMRPGPTRRPVLAQLRSPQFTHAGTTRVVERYRDGQAWPIVTEIGRSLTGALSEGALRIGRTSSQDAGVDAEADLIVATASLEVGFNDSRVGLMLQHKAPHNAAAFIQRRGRAGRFPTMRPWTVVVLSDYGRDRLTYQGYEQLFYPEVAAQRLPVQNRFVLKIQGTHALLDWLSQAASRGGTWVDARRGLRSPRTAGPTAGADRIRQILTELLESTERQDDLARFLEHALSTSADEVQAVLWEEPRSLILAVVPTALRRLNAQWQTVDGPETEPGDLLPEFTTRALFDPLDLPDVVLALPFANGDENRMPILTTLREAVPGRVSRRFGVRRDDHRTWIEPPASGVLELDQFVLRGVRLGDWTPEGAAYQVVRPLELQLKQPDARIGDSSQATPRWRSQFVVPGDATSAPIPEHSRWADLVTDVRFAAHVSGNQIEVRRMTPGADGELLLPNGVKQRTQTAYAIDGEPAALGFALEVDGLVIDVAPLDGSDPALGQHLLTPAWRTLAFQTLVHEDPGLQPITNAFQREWLTLVYLTAYGVAALNSPPGTDLNAALANGVWARDIDTILAVVYRSADPNNPVAPTPGRLTGALTDLATDPVVCAAVEGHAKVLTQPDPSVASWSIAERAYVDTLAAAIRETVTRMVPDAQDSDFITDVIARRGGGYEIVVTETSNGGLGLIEQLRAHYTRDFRRFWNLVEAALGPSDYEAVDRSIRLLLDDAATNASGLIANALSDFRAAGDTAAADRALTDLRKAWSNLAGPPRHLAIAAVASRLLRPGSGPDLVDQLRRLLAAWDDIEVRSGAEVDARVIAYAARQVDPQITLTSDQVFSLLWPRGGQARNRHLQHWQPYEPGRIQDRLLASAVVTRPVPAIDIVQPDWRDQYRNHLAAVDTIELRAPAHERVRFADAIRHVGTVSIDRGPLRIYGHLGRIVHSGHSITARVSIAEAEQ